MLGRIFALSSLGYLLAGTPWQRSPPGLAGVAPCGLGRCRRGDGLAVRCLRPGRPWVTRRVPSGKACARS